MCDEPDHRSLALRRDDQQRERSRLSLLTQKRLNNKTKHARSNSVIAPPAPLPTVVGIYALVASLIVLVGYIAPNTMHFTKPSWVVHKDSSKEHNAKRLSIFSVHVHPDGSRIATGGLDAKIRIWSTKPILNPASEESGKPPKSLCTLTMHTGPVLVVRWAHSGRWLASGSDDAIVMIWDLDPYVHNLVFLFFSRNQKY